MEELLRHLDNGKTLGYISLAAITITIIAHLIFKQYRYVKYLPGFIIIGIGLSSLYKVMNDLTATKSIDSLVIFLMGFLGGFVALCTALIIGIYEKPRRIKKKEKRQ